MRRVEQRIEINAPVDVCYTLWRDFTIFPRIMPNIISISPTADPHLWHWKIKGPFGKPLECDIHLDLLHPNKIISWHSLPPSELANSGSVNFEKMNDCQTRIDVDFAFSLPPGLDQVKEWVAEFVEQPELVLSETLKRFKMIAEEVGESPSCAASILETSQPSGREKPAKEHLIDLNQPPQP